jgi:mRNA interferase RelE/StbE
MVLEIVIGSKADRFLQSVNQQTFDRLIKKIKELAINPQPRGVKKVLSEEGVFRVRIGMFRILYSLEENDQVLLIVNIDKRSKVYKR